MNAFVTSLVDVLLESKDHVDHTFLSVLLRVESVFDAFKKIDGLVLPYLEHTTPLLNQVKGVQAQTREEVEEQIAHCQSTVVLQGIFDTSVVTMLLVHCNQFQP